MKRFVVFSSLLVLVFVGVTIADVQHKFGEVTKTKLNENFAGLQEEIDQLKKQLATASVIPKGTVVATTAKSCSEGWVEYNAQGRVIVGAGGTDFPPGDFGGDPKQRLTLANLPPHSHQQKLSGGHGSLPGYTHVANQNWGFKNHGNNVEHRTDLGEGKAMPFSIMQPYVALVFCEKE